MTDTGNRTGRGDGLRRFNTMSDDDVSALLGSCLAVPRWIEQVAAARPYPDAASLVSRADAAAGRFTEEELVAALERHPRIGERPESQNAESAFSRREQSGVDADDARLADLLREGNAEYETRFGRVFLIRAAGRSAAEILDELRRRFGNDPGTEACEVAGQLREIALLRLREVLGL